MMNVDRLQRVSGSHPSIYIHLCDVSSLPESTEDLFRFAENFLGSEEIISARRYFREEDRRLAISSRLLQQQLLRSHSSRWKKKPPSVRSKISSSSFSSSSSCKTRSFASSRSSLSLSSQNTSSSISPCSSSSSSSFSSDPVAVEREDSSLRQKKSLLSIDSPEEKEEEESEEEEEDEELRDYERIERNRSGQKPIWICRKRQEEEEEDAKEKEEEEERAPFIHFNISHDSDVVALVSSHLLVGVDLMKISVRGGAKNGRKRSVDEFLRAMDSQCVGKERDYLHDSSSSSSISPYQRLRRFMHIWTIKEAFVKTLGTGIYTDPQRLECRDLGEDFIYPCVRREGAEEILEIDISMATTSLPEREEHSEKRFCCTYTPSVSSDEKQQTSPSSSTSSSSSDQAEMKERNPSFSREKDCASLRLPNPVKILLDGVEQKEFHFECFSIAPPRSSSSSQKKEKEDEEEEREEREEEEEYLLTVCWAPVSSAHEKYRKCCMQFSPRASPPPPSLDQRHSDRATHKEGDEKKDVSSQESRGASGAASVVYVHLNMSWIAQATLLQKHKRVASSSSSSSSRPSSSSSSHSPGECSSSSSSFS